MEMNKKQIHDEIIKVMSGMPPYPDFYLHNKTIKPFSDQEDAYIQHDPEAVCETQKNFVNLCYRLIGGDCFLRQYDNDFAQRHGIIGRILSDSHGREQDELYKTWVRFMSIDVQYREWGQPAFATLRSETKDTNRIYCLNKIVPEITQYIRDKKLEKLLNGK